jgi:hypothetical protein
MNHHVSDDPALLQTTHLLRESAHYRAQLKLLAKYLRKTTNRTCSVYFALALFGFAATGVRPDFET